MIRHHDKTLIAKKHIRQDLRSPVLLIISVAILGWSWFPSAPTQHPSTYYLVPAQNGGKAELIRLHQDLAIPEDLPAGTFAMSQDLPCGAAPPELTRLFHLPLPVNQADQESLIQLSGIGPKLSERIITFREAQGPINGPDDFIRIKGIGPKLTARLTPLLCFASVEKIPAQKL
ncbi:MAG: helix-hairpin-helix domain-containing protein [Candidatus Electrothrix sp. MAN1_4]|nr:helix-hairpin-helix domain-containing protein [Candidatus Electrothrix sp. MAN1_4]